MRVFVAGATGVLGRRGLAYLSRLRGADNTRARRTLNWQPRYPSWRQGFEHDFLLHSAATTAEGAHQQPLEQR
jgi:nucleoside-diphosphate-sugar epimerase